MTRVAPLALAATAVVLLSACAQPATAPAPVETSPPSATVEVVPAGDDEDTPDCDREDWATRETPDCGWLDAGRFVPWTWAPKRSTPPVGWRPEQERRVTVQATQAAPRTTAPRVSGDDRREPAPTKDKPTTPTKRSKR